jgi:hypothetical protein
MSLILPPRFEDRAADEAMMLAIPIYVEEPSASLRPTWLPVDPSTWPPRRRSRKWSFADFGKIALGLVATFALSFGGVVAPHFAREFAAKRALANSTSAAATIATDAVATVDPAAPSARSSAAQTKAVASGVVLTVDVNDLPVSKDFPRNRKTHSAGSRRGS